MAQIAVKRRQHTADQRKIDLFLKPMQLQTQQMLTVVDGENGTKKYKRRQHTTDLRKNDLSFREKRQHKSTPLMCCRNMPCNEKSDVWPLVCILFEMWTLGIPFVLQLHIQPIPTSSNNFQHHPTTSNPIQHHPR